MIDGGSYILFVGLCYITTFPLSNYAEWIFSLLYFRNGEDDFSDYIDLHLCSPIDTN